MTATTRSASAESLPSLNWPLICAWPLCLLCFTLPGRAGPDGADVLDVIALMKVGVRFLTIGIFGITILRAWHSPRRPTVIACLLPYGVFVAWAIVSVVWSPLKSVTIGQAGGLLGLYLFAMCIALLWKGPEDTARVVFHLTAATAVFCTAMTIIDLGWHDLSGLNREEWTEEAGASTGFIHPTTGGATASIGLVLLCGAWLVLRAPWASRLLVPAGIFFAAMLFLAMSRTAIGVGLAVLAPVFLFRLNPLLSAAVVLAVSLGGFAYLMVDPGLDGPDEIIQKVAAKVTRGESAESLSSFTGRTDLWDAIWVEVYRSPYIGHGYFVSSAKGEIDVWQGPANRTAHNMLLQVLVSTGAVGVCLFVFGLLWPIFLAARSFLETDRRLPMSATQRDAGWFLLLCLAWYLGWGQMSESFMGPVQAESVIFYGLLGLAVAHVRSGLLFMPRRDERLAPRAAEAAV